MYAFGNASNGHERMFIDPGIGHEGSIPRLDVMKVKENDISEQNWVLFLQYEGIRCWKDRQVNIYCILLCAIHIFP